VDLVVYGASLSPFVRKVEAVLGEKGIEYELEHVMMPFPDWFTALNPARRMPVLRDRDIAADGPKGVIPDSSAICAYLDRAVPEPAVYPKDAYDCGRAAWYEEYADSDFAGCIGMGVFRPIVFPIFAKQEPDVATARKTVSEKLPRFFDYFEGELDGGSYLVGNACSIADISVATQLVSLELAIGPLDASRWPGLAGLFERVTTRPSFTSNLEVCRKIIKKPVDLGL
jgi:glutathione S-transferase